MDGVMRALSEKKTPWNEDLLFAVKLAWEMLSKYYIEVTPSMGMLQNSAHILDHFRKLWSLRMWDKETDIDPEDKSSNTIQYQEAFLKFVQNEYYAKHRHVPVNIHEIVPRSNLIPSGTVLESRQSSCEPTDLSSDDDEYLAPNNVTE